MWHPGIVGEGNTEHNAAILTSVGFLVTWQHNRLSKLKNKLFHIHQETKRISCVKGIDETKFYSRTTSILCQQMMTLQGQWHGQEQQLYFHIPFAHQQGHYQPLYLPQIGDEQSNLVAY